MDVEIAFYLGGVYKAKADAVVKDIQFWGQYLPPSHIERLERIRSTYETMKGEMKRAVANAVPTPMIPEEQILLWVKILESED